jgi:hypothetical protein
MPKPRPEAAVVVPALVALLFGSVMQLLLLSVRLRTVR